MFFGQENDIKACLLVLSPFSAHFYHPLHRNGVNKHVLMFLDKKTTLKHVCLYFLHLVLTFIPPLHHNGNGSMRYAVTTLICME